jgi:23S rRNA pseudouridine1911/1915/1917 synthase
MARAESIIVAESRPGVRLDRFLADHFPDASRGRLQELITTGAVLVNDRQSKPTYAPRAGDHIVVQWPDPVPLQVEAQDIPLDVLFEDADILVLNKPAELVVHPAAGHSDGTLVNALLHHCRGRLSGIGGVERPGIVHRLDLGTSGCLVVAKSDVAHIRLSAQFAGREVEKIYEGIAIGDVRPVAGEIRAPIARHETHRKKMSVASTGEGRDAWTSYRVIESLAGACHVECQLHTGRTHQIRVHLAHLGFPLLGDEVYGQRANARFRDLSPVRVERQMLHARKLAFLHPVHGRHCEFNAPLPADFQSALEQLRHPVTPAGVAETPGRPRSRPARSKSR